ncbi:hypothetical protein Ccrd_009824 [Cynara cardunculus var. scolymus]|uniref:Uncharacterized protein n=1 Tax=Cynara cardunculus var. scolymus TaxID=59895 RepID=A0A103YME9_CYNCS|nr:hypothetical protein Ccrd_009824 [Cynara cardunculus var. scolymus]
MASSSSSLRPANGGFLLQKPSSSSFSNNRHSATAIGREIDSGLGIRRNKGESFRVAVANPNVTIASGKSRKEVIMVDPVEAKRLAAKQMPLTEHGLCLALQQAWSLKAKLEMASWRSWLDTGQPWLVFLLDNALGSACRALHEPICCQKL